MQKKWFRPVIPHVIAVVVFLLVAVIYSRPAFDHKVLSQQDLSQWKAMAQNSFQYKETHGHFPLWSEGMFSGMPGYLLAMESQAFSPQKILYNVLTLWLPKPASFFFLACICFYFLSLVLRVNPYVGIIGGLAYAYASYNAVIIYVGHDTKMQAIALLPAFIGSLLLIYEKRYWWGVALLALSTSLFVSANHPQIIYYCLIITVFITVGYAIRWIREKDFRHLLIAGALTILGGLTGVLYNAVETLVTIDYSKASIRGGSELATAGGQVTKTGLSQDYAFSYSMYKSEPFELLAPKIYGGSSGLEVPEDKSKAIAALQEMPPELARQIQQQGLLNFYWGGILPSTSGPVYAGAIICFLALLGFVILDGKHKWWILGACVLGIVMSWGGYFAGFNGFLLRVLPGYDKFRAPSMTMVIPNFLLCVMAVLSLQKLITVPASGMGAFWEQYKKGLYLTGGVFVVLLLIYFSLDYTRDVEKQLLKNVTTQGGQVAEYVRHFVQGLREDRQGLFMGSLLRSFLFVALAAILAGLAIKGKMRPLLMLGLIGALSFIDLIGIDLDYLNNDRYQDEEDAVTPFNPTAADQQILLDKGYYRVFDLRQGGREQITNNASTAMFHRSIGGYHPAKLSIYQDLLEHQLYQYPDCRPVLNMLNTKYIILPTRTGSDSVMVNPDALGAAWFVHSVKFAPTAQGVMDGLTGLDTKDTAIVFEADRAKVYDPAVGDTTTARDSIGLVKNDNDEMEYQSVSSRKRFAVFSEVFYDRGWKATIDGAEAPIIRTDYVLRGLVVPAGKHSIRFVFHPASFYTGQTVQGVASFVLLLLFAGAVVVEWRKKVRGENNFI